MLGIPLGLLNESSPSGFLSISRLAGVPGLDAPGDAQATATALAASFPGASAVQVVGWDVVAPLRFVGSNAAGDGASPSQAADKNEVRGRKDRIVTGGCRVQGAMVSGGVGLIRAPKKPRLGRRDFEALEGKASTSRPKWFRGGGRTRSKRLGFGSPPSGAGRILVG